MEDLIREYRDFALQLIADESLDDSDIEAIVEKFKLIEEVE